MIEAVDRNGVLRNYMNKDLVCCIIIDVLQDHQKMFLSMKDTEQTKKNKKPLLGLIQSDCLPDRYK